MKKRILTMTLLLSVILTACGSNSKNVTTDTEPAQDNSTTVTDETASKDVLTGAGAGASSENNSSNTVDEEADSEEAESSSEVKAEPGVITEWTPELLNSTFPKVFREYCNFKNGKLEAFCSTDDNTVLTKLVNADETLAAEYYISNNDGHRYCHIKVLDKDEYYDINNDGTLIIGGLVDENHELKYIKTDKIDGMTFYKIYDEAANTNYFVNTETERLEIVSIDDQNGETMYLYIEPLDSLDTPEWIDNAKSSEKSDDDALVSSMAFGAVMGAVMDVEATNDRELVNKMYNNDLKDWANQAMNEAVDKVSNTVDEIRREQTWE